MFILVATIKSKIMRKLNTLCIAILLMFTNCDDKKKDLTAQYDELMKQGDSIEVAHQDFMKTHNKMSDVHQKFKEDIKSITLEDSTILADIARHDVILKRHDALIKSHDELFEMHSNLKSELDAMTDAEMEAKIAEMKVGHEKIRSEHASMEKEHDMIMDEHKAIEKAITESPVEKDGEED